MTMDIIHSGQSIKRQRTPSPPRQSPVSLASQHFRTIPMTTGRYRQIQHKYLK